MMRQVQNARAGEIGGRTVSEAHLFWGLMAMIALLVFVGAGLFSLMWLMG